MAQQGQSSSGVLLGGVWGLREPSATRSPRRRTCAAEPLTAEDLTERLHGCESLWGTRGSLSDRTRLGARMALPDLSRSRRPDKARRCSWNGRAGGGMEQRERNRTVDPWLPPQLTAGTSPPPKPHLAALFSIAGSIVRRRGASSEDHARAPALFPHALHKSRIAFLPLSDTRGSILRHAARPRRRPSLCAEHLRCPARQVQAARPRLARPGVGAAGWYSRV